MDDLKFGHRVRVRVLGFLEGVKIPEEFQEARQIGRYGKIVGFVSGYGGNVCIVQMGDTCQRGYFSRHELGETFHESSPESRWFDKSA
ncbi:MAG: hypothetical protein WC227_03745 [Patescibacteria group bacterium]